MSDRLGRFKRLERIRGGPEADPSARPAQARFGAVEPATADAPESRATATAGRFSEREAGLQLDDSRPDDQPFIRCARCEADNHVQATHCTQCASDLATDEQRSFNERLWAERREVAVREKEELERFRRDRDQADAGLSEARRQVGAELARHTMDRVQDRWEAEVQPEDAFFGGTPLGIRLLKRVPGIGARVVLIALSLGLPLLLLLLPRTRVIGAVALFLVLSLCAPARRRRTPRGW